MIENKSISQNLGNKNNNNKGFITKESPDQNIKEIPFIEYTIEESNSKIYELKIFHTEKIISFHIKEKSDINEKKYIKQMILEEFYNLNRFFRQYLSLEELYTLLFKNMKNSEITISEDIGQIKLIFIIECRGVKENILLTLEQEQSEIENLVYNLCEKIKKVDMQIKINEKLTKEFNQIKKNYISKEYLFIFGICIIVLCILIQIFIVNPLGNELKSLKNDFKQLKSNNNIMSRIIRSDELFLIQEQILKIFNKNITKYELLFRASRDGYRAKDFHNKCDGQKNTITFVKTKGGKRFGGFTRISWDIQNRYINSQQDFTFSLDNEKVFYIENNNNNNIYIKNNEGPTFIGKYGFKIFDNSDISTSKDNSYDYYQYNQFGRSIINNEYLSENSNFYVRDYEVFKIYF